MQTKNLEFQVEAVTAQRFKVSWKDGDDTLWFHALIGDGDNPEQPGDQILRVLPGANNRWPTIIRHNPNPGGAKYEYIDCANGEAAAVILNATRYIREHKLASTARKLYDEQQAQIEQARIREAAFAVVRALGQARDEANDIADALGLPGISPEDREAIRRVIHMSDAYLYRVADILGCA